jgi:mercuric ion binding protein
MKRISVFFTALAFVALTAITALTVVTRAQAEGAMSHPVAAAEQSATFDVEKMTCAACPITVRKAMEGIHGVKSVSVDFDAKTATAIFDPSVTSLEQIGAASTNAGYPAAPAS